MNILCVIDSLTSGGAQRQLVNLAIGFKDKGHNVSFLVYHKLDFYKSQLDKKNIHVHYVLESNYLIRLFKMRKFIRNGKFDSVLSFLQAPNFICEISGFPFRKWSLVVGERSANPNILKSKKSKTYRWFHLFADCVVSNSFANIEIVRKANPFLTVDRLHVIYNLVYLQNNSVAIPEKCDKARICIAASYDELKNLNGLIEAVNILPIKYKNRLIINWYGRKLIKGKISPAFNKAKEKIDLYNLSDTIKLNDATPNIIEAYLSSDFVALVSHHEGFPNSICEGMALGKPIISSKVSDIPEFVKDGKNGFLCESSNIESIKECLIKAIDTDDEKRKSMGKHNLILAEKLFNKNVIFDQYLKLMSHKIVKQNY